MDESELSSLLDAEWVEGSSETDCRGGIEAGLGASDNVSIWGESKRGVA